MGGITSKTVFILGAGASKPYGYPTGYELNKFIKEATKPNLTKNNYGSFFLEAVAPDKIQKYESVNNPYYIELLDILNSMNLNDPNHLQNFNKLFTEVSMNSIDEFIVKFNHFERISKILICQRIMRCENLELIMSDDDWYSELWSILISGGGQHLDQNLNNCVFISFNYDRSLEFFLYSKLRAYFDYDKSETDKYFSENVKIFHPYGRISDFTENFNLRQHNPYEMYGFHFNKYISNYSHVFIEYSNKINVIGNRATDETKKDIQHQISNASKIVFLGFGFNEENLKILGIVKGRHNIAGTWYKLPFHIQQEVNAKFRPHNLKDCTIKEFFTNHYIK